MSVPPRVLLVLLAGLIGCDGPAEAPSGQTSGQKPAPAVPAEPATTEVRPDGPAPSYVARVRKGEDGPTRDLAAGAVLSTGPEGLFLLDFREGGRVRLSAGTRAILGDETPSQLHLIEGRARVLLPPVGNTRRAAVRVALPAATVVLERSGELWVAAGADGSAAFLVEQGGAVVTNGEVTKAGSDGLRGWSLRAGEVLLARPGRAPTGPRAAPPDEAGRERLLDGVQSAQATRSPGAGAAREALEVVLSRLVAERKRGQDLTLRHREAVRGRSPEEAALRRDLVAHSQALSRLSARTLALWERVRGLLVLAGQEPDPVLARRVREARSP